MKQRTHAFTIVELLIVIVVIAILAAISLSAYNGIQDRAIEATVKSDLANFAKKIELAKIESGGSSYPLIPSTDAGISATKSVYKTGVTNWIYCYTVISGEAREYALGVIDVKDRVSFISSRDGLEANVSISMANFNSCSKYAPAARSILAGYAYGPPGVWGAWIH